MELKLCATLIMQYIGEQAFLIEDCGKSHCIDANSADVADINDGARMMQGELLCC